jgi:hypothetical protein
MKPAPVDLAVPYGYVLAAASELNQCDGCRRGLPLNASGIHRGEGYDLIGCTADRYAMTTEREAVANASGTK